MGRRRQSNFDDPPRFHKKGKVWYHVSGSMPRVWTKLSSDRAEALRKWLLTDRTEAEVLVRDVVQYGPNPLRETRKARAALRLLEKHGWLAPLDPGTVVRGAARKEAWRIVKGGGDVV